MSLELIIFLSIAGITAIGFLWLTLASICQQPGPTYKELMDWDFRSCEQMREHGWPENEIAELMRRKGNFYDKDYESHK